MAVSLSFFDYSLNFILMSILGIIQGSSLVFGSRTLKKAPSELRFVNSLIVAGYILTIWCAGAFFLPTRIKFSSSDKLISFTVIVGLYYIIPNSVFIILGIALLYFFYKNNHIYKKPLVYTSILFIGGYVLNLVIGVLRNYSIIFDSDIYFDFIDLFLALNILSQCILIGVILIILLFSIYLKNKYLMIFSSLYLVHLFASLIPMLPTI